MPCYTEVTEEERAAGYRREFRHNSDVAQMLCKVLRWCEAFPMSTGDISHHFGKEVKDWYVEHKERDLKKAEQEQKDKEYQRKLKEWEAKKPKR